MQQQRHIPRFIRRVMPDASEEQLFEATENLKRYMAVVLRIYNRIHNEPHATDSRDFNLYDRFDHDPTM